MQVGQSGIQLSGGQKQRIAIARALVKVRPLLQCRACQRCAAVPVHAGEECRGAAECCALPAPRRTRASCCWTRPPARWTPRARRRSRSVCLGFRGTPRSWPANANVLAAASRVCLAASAARQGARWSFRERLSVVTHRWRGFAGGAGRGGAGADDHHRGAPPVHHPQRHQHRGGAGRHHPGAGCALRSSMIREASPRFADTASPTNTLSTQPAARREALALLFCCSRVVAW